MLSIHVRFKVTQDSSGLFKKHTIIPSLLEVHLETVYAKIYLLKLSKYLFSSYYAGFPTESKLTSLKG